MLDENLPTFYLKPSSDSQHTSTIYLSQNASELKPEYTLRRPDPSQPESKNCFAVALCDSYNSEVLFAEVLVQPDWTQPSLSAAELRAQNGIPPPPVPIVPNAFTIQLYNPDQQVVVRQIPGSWNSSAHWEFEMPQTTFRLPSASALDRSQSDPAAADTTPKISFKWKRDGKLSKDITCYLAGTMTGKKNKEPDITVAMFKGGKNLNLYEPNMHRIEIEDVKGLEVVFLLSSIVIKDIYFNASREMFNISSPNMSARKSSDPAISGQFPSNSIGKPGSPSQPAQSKNALAQWEVEAETARLRALMDAEKQERAQKEQAEEQRIREMLRREEEEQRRQDAEVEKETERLRRKYGVKDQSLGPRNQTAIPPPLPTRPQDQHASRPNVYPSDPNLQTAPNPRPMSTGPGVGATYDPRTNQWTPGPPHNSNLNQPSYPQPSGTAGSSAGGCLGFGGKKMTKKRSSGF